ncbi:hypothetical protein LCGC14_2206110, partial [marine sediment metagenome]
LLILVGVAAFKLWAGEEILPGDAPTAVASAQPVEVVPGAEVSFDGSESYDKDIKVTWQETESGWKYNFLEVEIDGVVTNWSWDFGDGNSGEGETASHEYTEPGEYTVILTITADHEETATATVTVTVVTPSLRLTAEPTSIPVSTEEEQSTSTLTVRIEDNNGNLITDVSYTVNLTLSDDNLGTLEPTTLTVEGEEEATFTAGNQSGYAFITASGEGLNEAYTNINIHGPLHHVVVTPESATLHIGESQQFTARGYDANGISVPNLTFSWSGGEGAGDLSSDGLFTAAALSGWKTITAAETQTDISGTAQVRVIPSLHHITVTPDPVTLKVGDTQSFTATGYDAQNNVVPITPTWSVTGNIGTIDNEGNFSATTLGTGSVEAAASRITGSASVTVDGDGDQPPTVTISADPSALEPGTNTTITVIVRRGDEPESGVSVSLTASAVNQSGGHQHNSNRPINTPNPSTGTTGSDGKFSSDYTTTAFGGEETITATAEGQTVSLTLNVRVPGLVQLATGTGYDLTGETSAHPNNHYGTSTTNSALQGIARDFAVAYPEEPDLGYNDMSLTKGGGFDIKNGWDQDINDSNRGHTSHRKGRNCDLDNIDEGMGHLDKLKDIIETTYN